MFSRSSEPASTSAPTPTMSQEEGLSRRALWAQGQPVSYLMHQALAHPELISLAAGFVDQQTLPVEPVRQAMDAILSDPRTARRALQYGTTIGDPLLREMLLERLRSADGRTATEMNLSVDQFMITAGSNQLLHLLGDTLLDPGDIVLVTSPSYFVFLGTLNNLGAHAIGVESDADGMIPEALADELARHDTEGTLGRVKAIYVMSYFDNPRGTTLAAERRPAIVEIARRFSRTHPIYVIEDSAYRDMRYAGEDLASLRSYDDVADTVVMTGTFSKAFSPGIRVGYGVLPTALIEPIGNQKGNVDFGSPNFNQYLMAKVFELDLFDAHIERLRASYRVKLAAMLDAADVYLGPFEGVRWQLPYGGLYVWLELPEQIDTGPTGKLLDHGIEEGVSYVPGEYCFPGRPDSVPRNCIRLSFGVQPPERITEGIAALGRALRRTMDE